LMQTENLLEFEDYALEQGSYRAKVIETSKLVIDDRVRLKCQVPICQDYNNHLMCPPHTLSVKKFSSLCGQYERAILIQVKSEGFDKSACLEAEKQLHLIINKVESMALSKGLYLSTGFIGSSCKLCDECVGYHSHVPCRRPFEARPSIEGMGVDVLKTAAQAGIGFSLAKSDDVIYCGLILLG